MFNGTVSGVAAAETWDSKWRPMREVWRHGNRGADEQLLSWWLEADGGFWLIILA